MHTKFDRMKFDRTGILLYTIEYRKCVDFYENLIGLPKMFETERLTCFEFGDSYLMLELDSEYDEHKVYEERIRTCLRMNVSNVREVYDNLILNNIKADYQEHSWGVVVKFYDPDGNLCAFKDSEKFEQQIMKGRAQ